MLSLNRLRIALSARAALHPNRPVCAPKAGSRPAHSLPNRDAWHRKVTAKAPGEERGLTWCTGPGLRTFCTSRVQQGCWNCWNCNLPLGQTPAFFCRSCKVVQPPEEGASYFHIMDCDYTFTLDTQKLQTRYLQLQRSLHPDNFSQKSEEYSESQSALVNKAYKTLRKPLSRGLYMLELEGMGIEEGTDSGADAEFLMELMEINEALDEAQTLEEANKIAQDTKGKLADLTEQTDAALRKGELQTAKALLAQMKYQANIEEKVKEKLSQLM
ncbi:iron-sulfur cluster co-chaperone protein HscB isoform X2 [Echeneis naucrates]|uniref:iron-sulfur cluster co-chaperone protein HscB isoform X2 n=1 Tax=Echeneis naucrates TaxID=173247 RepID=UPI00111469A9|nr:iron-sulfur cluster co-chaperone protein HscB isoform X2 [Echeneis naucrates]